MPNKTMYLGDGVYAYWDDLEIVIYTERDGVKHWISLDETVLENLNLFAELPNV